ncbi:hypothetical protein Q8A67_023539 [Cirrhinus molitorella]|uniref:Uncharacterized protein n=1 Tax=Cirrhinus molitorella TaxID=172907 RepID=A0AA88TCN3_9TELE|nr:hypothetical protein Q8A67_023539 [Cirrhinus molitorella]
MSVRLRHHPRGSTSLPVWIADDSDVKESSSVHDADKDLHEQSQYRGMFIALQSQLEKIIERHTEASISEPQRAGRIKPSTPSSHLQAKQITGLSSPNPWVEKTAACDQVMKVIPPQILSGPVSQRPAEVENMFSTPSSELNLAPACCSVEQMHRLCLRKNLWNMRERF